MKLFGKTVIQFYEKINVSSLQLDVHTERKKKGLHVKIVSMFWCIDCFTSLILRVVRLNNQVKSRQTAIWPQSTAINKFNASWSWMMNTSQPFHHIDYQLLSAYQQQNFFSTIFLVIIIIWHLINVVKRLMDCVSLNKLLDS